jgi:hypothetical protein
MPTKIDAKNCYYGIQKPTITADDLVASSIQPAQKQAVAAQMQTAFDLYYRAWQAARSFGDTRLNAKTPPHVRQAIENVKTQMERELRHAADSGMSAWALGGHLKWAFEHLESTGGVWKDTSFNGWNGLTMPYAIVNFMEQVEAAQGALGSGSYSEWQGAQNRIKRQKKLAQWDSLGTDIDWAKKSFEKITPKLWAYFGACEKAAASAGDIGVKWLGYGASLHNYASLYLKVRYNKDGAREAMLAEAAALVVQNVPIFGTAYADVIRGVPGLVNWFKAYAERQRQAINGVFR